MIQQSDLVVGKGKLAGKAVYANRDFKKGYSNAVCKYNFKYDGIVDGKQQVYEGYGKKTLRRIDGNWRIIE